MSIARSAGPASTGVGAAAGMAGVASSARPIRRRNGRVSAVIEGILVAQRPDIVTGLRFVSFDRHQDRFGRQMASVLGSTAAWTAPAR